LGRKSFYIALALVLLLIAAVVGLFSYLLSREPKFYAAAEVPPGPDRQQASENFEKEATSLYSQIQNETEWETYFDEHEVNSWLAEDFIRSNLVQHLPKEISDPRVAFQPDRVLLAFRYGADSVSSVVSIEARVWMSRQEPNTIALQIEQMKAGALPLTTRFVQERLTESAHNLDIDLQWYRHDGYPVAVLRFQSQKREPTVQLEELKLMDGRIYLKGRSLDPNVVRAAENTFGYESPR